ncbi:MULTISPECIES: adenylate/guanylate cyclase domain-containing protein [Microbacterium]|uniref:adenylate/guanylate cyclase domain-containing protein n=1 Tax=Microbacterium TaxID=33882 RepID=UPI00146F0899|nr:MULTISPECIES: adenylate/guanylate cyclase domain-containing protein [Microbacterium]
MGLKDQVTNYVRETFGSDWEIKVEDEVPTEDDALPLTNGGVQIEAAVLYADLRDSTGLVARQTREFAAEVYKTYVRAAVRSVGHYSGTVTAYDGDRVMGVFMGGQARNHAVGASTLISAIVEDIIQPELNAQYGAGKYKVEQKVGIDWSTLTVANTGIRGNNDYVWVGTAANNAAKLATLRRGYTTYATSAVYDVLNEANRTLVSGAPMWTDLGTSDLGFRVYGANARKVHIPNY